METIRDLEKYLENECYSFLEISVGSHHAPEGVVIEKKADCYNFSYSERGKKEIIKSFSSEKDLVCYAMKRLNEDEWFKAHLVAWVWNEAEIKEAEKELKNLNIEFKRNDIPNFSKGKRAYRIFVFGKDVLALDELKEKYFRR